MIREGLTRPWICQATIKLADDDELLELAARSGCQCVFIEFESPTVEGWRRWIASAFSRWPASGMISRLPSPRGQHVFQRGRVVPITGEHLMSQKESIPVHRQAHQHLLAVAPMVP